MFESQERQTQRKRCAKAQCVDPPDSILVSKVSLFRAWTRSENITTFADLLPSSWANKVASYAETQANLISKGS